MFGGGWTATRHRVLTDPHGQGSPIYDTPSISAHNTVLLKAEVVHRLIYSLLDFLPVRPPLNELVNLELVGILGHQLDRDMSALFILSEND